MLREITQHERPSTHGGHLLEAHRVESAHGDREQKGGGQGLGRGNRGVSVHRHRVPVWEE